MSLPLLLPKSTLEHFSGLLAIPFSIFDENQKSYYSSGKIPSNLPVLQLPILRDKEQIGTLVGRDSPESSPILKALQTLLTKELELRTKTEQFEFDSQHRNLLIKQIQTFSSRLSSTVSEDQSIKVFLDELKNIFHVKQTSLFLVESDQQLTLAATNGEVISDLETVRYVCYSGKTIVSDDPERDSRFLTSEGAPRPDVSKLKNAMVVPIPGSTQAMGAIYFANRNEGNFTPTELQVALNLAQTLSNSLTQIRNHKIYLKNEKVKASLERYMSPNLVQKISENTEITDTWNGNRINGTVLFSDIRGFTKLSEQISPEAMVTQLNEYFEEMTQIIFAQEGTLDKFVGDMIMVIFGAPNPQADAPMRAIRTAIAMQKRLKALNEKWSKENKPRFEMGIGINTGPMIFGNIGSKRAMGITVIGDHVNIAHRLQSMAKATEIMISPEVIKAIPGGSRLPTDSMGEVDVKGKKITAFRLNYSQMITQIGQA